VQFLFHLEVTLLNESVSKSKQARKYTHSITVLMHSPHFHRRPFRMAPVKPASSLVNALCLRGVRLPHWVTSQHGTFSPIVARLTGDSPGNQVTKVAWGFPTQSLPRAQTLVHLYVESSFMMYDFNQNCKV
jgi:hypothetical protein